MHHLPIIRSSSLPLGMLCAPLSMARDESRVALEFNLRPSLLLNALIARVLVCQS